MQVWMEFEEIYIHNEIQRRALKFLVSSDLDYKTRLIVPNLLPLSLWLEAQDILLLIKMLNGPPDNFQLDDYVVLVSSNARASTSNHLKRVQPTIPQLNSTKFFYFKAVQESSFHSLLSA